MATYSSILAWKMPWAEQPRGLKSMERDGSSYFLLLETSQGMEWNRLQEEE